MADSTDSTIPHRYPAPAEPDPNPTAKAGTQLPQVKPPEARQRVMTREDREVRSLELQELSFAELRGIGRDTLKIRVAAETEVVLRQERGKLLGTVLLWLTGGFAVMTVSGVGALGLFLFVRFVVLPRLF